MKNILITGATSGIGEKTSEYLSQNGYRLILVGRDSEKLNTLKSKLGDGHKYILYDLEKTENIGDIFSHLKTEGIKLDGMVYCAGIVSNQGIRGIDISLCDRIFRVNYESYLAMCSYFVKKDCSNEGASIVSMSSLSAKTCYSGTAAYSVSKASILTLNKVLAKEVIKRKIRVNAVLPGYVRTPMMSGSTDEDICAEQPWGFIEPEEIARVIEFLLNDCSRMITGAEIPVSGGMSF